MRSDDYDTSCGTEDPAEACPRCRVVFSSSQLMALHYAHTHGEVDRLDPALFDPTYKVRMIAAYPVIAGLTSDEAWCATVNDREVAFRRILASRNLRRTHELYLEAHTHGEGQ